MPSIFKRILFLNRLIQIFFKSVNLPHLCWYYSNTLWEFIPWILLMSCSAHHAIKVVLLSSKYLFSEKKFSLNPHSPQLQLSKYWNISQGIKICHLYQIQKANATGGGERGVQGAEWLSNSSIIEIEQGLRVCEVQHMHRHLVLLLSQLLHRRKKFKVNLFVIPSCPTLGLHQWLQLGRTKERRSCSFMDLANVVCLPETQREDEMLKATHSWM